MKKRFERFGLQKENIMSKLALVTLTFCAAASMASGEAPRRPVGFLRSRAPVNVEGIRAKSKAEREAALPKMQAALKEIAGVEFGQAEPDGLSGNRPRAWIPLQKPYRYFTRMRPDYAYGRLVGVTLSFETEGKYSSTSVDAEIEATRKDVCSRLGIKPEEHQRRLLVSRASRGEYRFNGWVIRVGYGYASRSQAVELSIRDETLKSELYEADKKAKDSKLGNLPVFGSGDPASSATPGA